MPKASIPFPDQLAFWNDWHCTRGATGEDHGHRESRRVFLDQFPVDTSGVVLDLGCGQGHDLAAFARGRHDVYGLDFSPDAVRQARQALQREGVPNPEKRVLIHDLAQPLPYPDCFFDGAYSHLAIQYFDELVTASICEEVGRVLRPGCHLVMTVKSVDDPYCGQGQELGPDTWLRKGRVRRFFSEGEIKELLAAWTVLRVDQYPGYYASNEPSHFLRVVARRPV